MTGLLSGPSAQARTPSKPLDRTAGPGGIGLRLLDVPVSERNDPRARLYIIDRLAPGAMDDRRIEVSNTTASAVHVDLFAAAATIEHGSFLGLAGRTSDELSSWVSVLPGASEVPAGGSLTTRVVIDVPPDAASGEHYAVVWAEVRSVPAAGSGVTEVNRVGIRLYVSIGFGAAPASNFDIESLTAERLSDSRPSVVAAVHNTGGRALDIYGSLRLLSGPAGLSAGPFPASLGTTIAIGDTEPVTIVLSKQLPAGPWDAQLTLLSGQLRRSARATIIFPNAGTSPAALATTSSTQPSWLHPAIVGCVLLVAAALCFLLGRRSIRRRTSARNVTK